MGKRGLFCFKALFLRLLSLESFLLGSASCLFRLSSLSCSNSFQLFDPRFLLSCLPGQSQLLFGLLSLAFLLISDTLCLLSFLAFFFSFFCSDADSFLLFFGFFDLAGFLLLLQSKLFCFLGFVSVSKFFCKFESLCGRFCLFSKSLTLFLL